MELIFVRHGRPQQVQNSDGTPADPPLAEIGKEQALAVASWLGEETIDHIYTSPMRRARETSQPLEKRLGLTAIVRDDISEFDKDSSSYVPMEVLKETNRKAWERMASGAMSTSPETLSSWYTNTVTQLEEIVQVHGGQRVAVVCHGGVINAYLARCLEFDIQDFMKFDVDYTSVTRVLASGAGHRSVKSINETAHFRNQPHLAVR
ncbi:MAG: histidine phosphatase family protein [Acidimicrobiales bacterium]|jgi:probable phosphoglycerate mutase|nr:histidine phosphatase family protein [Acidimicrobiales bacterium]MDP6901266.1 histidine phosphatase family protein [Acidimicrobiales bacterium]HJM00195.1 histidine phosphatase family protein [Acidimicrobiales bacterium]